MLQINISDQSFQTLNASIKNAKVFNVCVISRTKVFDNSSVCNIIEWMEYHALIGVDHFFISDECSSEVQKKSLENYYDMIGKVTVARSHHVDQNLSCSELKSLESNVVNQIFHELVKNKCKWTLTLNTDEFLTIWNTDIESISIYLNNYHHTLIRLPRWNIGSDGHEKRPRKLRIQSYLNGILEHNHVNLFAISDEIEGYSSHTMNPMIRNGTTIKTKNDLLHKKYIEHTKLYKEEIRNIKIDEINEIMVPFNDIFIKHYYYLSWEEFSFIHSQNTKFADFNMREIWLHGNFSSSFVIASHFTNTLASKIIKVIENRNNNTLNKQLDNFNILPICLNFWGINT